jgi:hypothetical protein
LKRETSARLRVKGEREHEDNGDRRAAKELMKDVHLSFSLSSKVFLMQAEPR